MTVQDAVRTVHVPQQAGAAEPPPRPLPAAAPDRAAGPLPVRDRMLTAEERQFVLGLAVMLVVLSSIIVGGLSLAVHASG